MIKIDKHQQKKIHTRQIDIATYEGDADSIIVEGILHDERLIDCLPSHRGKSAARHDPPHDHPHAGQPPAELVIEDIDVEMQTAPRRTVPGGPWIHSGPLSAFPLLPVSRPGSRNWWGGPRDVPTWWPSQRHGAGCRAGCLECHVPQAGGPEAPARRPLKESRIPACSGVRMDPL